MANIEVTDELRNRLIDAQSAQEVNDILAASDQECAAQDAERIWQEIEKHKVDYGRDVSDDELESVAGGLNHRREEEGCAATVDRFSWCWSNDSCAMFDVIYDPTPNPDDWETGIPHNEWLASCLRERRLPLGKRRSLMLLSPVRCASAPFALFCPL